MGETLELTLDNRLEAIAPALEHLEAFCRAQGVAGRELGQLTLALDELLTNIMSYAWPQGGEHRIHLAVRLTGQGLVAELWDDGVAFDPRTAPEPDRSAALEDREIGGLGVYFAMTLMDRVDYQRIDGHNRLTLYKTIAPNGANK